MVSAIDATMFTYRRIDRKTYAVFLDEDSAASMKDVFAGMRWVCFGGYFNAFEIS